MKTAKKLISLIITASMAISMFASCADEGSPSSGNDSKSADKNTSQNEPVDETEVSIESLFTIEKEDNGEKTFSLLTTETQRYEYDAEEYTGEVVNDAVYDRNTAVEELLGIKLNFVYKPGDWANKDSYNQIISSSILANDGAYDIVSGMISCVQPTAASNYFMNVYDLKYINLDNPWWVSELQDNLTVNGKLFGFIGDASLSMYKGLSIIFANLKYIEDYSLESPYQLVYDNKWTLDKLISMAGEFKNDLNGDGKINEADDVIGMGMNEVVFRSIQASFNMKVIDIGSDGQPYVLGLTDPFATAVEKLNSFIKSESVYVKDGYTPDRFISDGSLFYMGKLESLDLMRDMDSDYAIIPFPKYDENQEKYLTQIATATQMYYIPVTTNDPDLTGKVCEALCYYSHKDVVPAYYDVALKNKYSRDTDTRNMLDIIRDGAVMSFEYAYSTALAGSTWPNKVMSDSAIGNGNVASTIAASQSTWTANITKILESFS